MHNRLAYLLSSFKNNTDIKHLYHELFGSDKTISALNKAMQRDMILLIKSGMITKKRRQYSATQRLKTLYKLPRKKQLIIFEIYISIVHNLIINDDYELNGEEKIKTLDTMFLSEIDGLSEKSVELTTVYYLQKQFDLKHYTDNNQFYVYMNRPQRVA